MTRRLLAELELPAPRPVGDPTAPQVGEIDVDRFVSRERFARERSAIFSRVPQLVAHSGELACPGACLPIVVAGVPLILVRDDEGVVRAFRNACRHRGTELVGEPCTKKAFVCPYHAWTYDLRGELIHVPHVSIFQGRERERPRLAPAHVLERYGLIWASLASFDFDEFVGPLDEDLATFDLAGAVLYRRHARDLRANWKTVIDAFLESYHIRILHAKSVYPFFFDGRACAELVGPHIRAVTARRDLARMRKDALDVDVLRTVATPSYLLFPNTIVIQHPDYTSLLCLEPLDAERTSVVHTMFIPEEPTTEKARAHREASYDLVDRVLLGNEDLAAIEAMQRGFQARADQTVLVGELEEPMLWFHASVDRMLA